MRIIGKRMKDLNRFESAGTIYESVGMFEEAVMSYV